MNCFFTILIILAIVIVACLINKSNGSNEPFRRRGHRRFRRRHMAGYPRYGFGGYNIGFPYYPSLYYNFPWYYSKYYYGYP